MRRTPSKQSDGLAVDLHGVDHAVQVDVESRHATLADRGAQVRVHILQLRVQSVDVDLALAVPLENAVDLRLDLAVRAALQCDPDGVVAVRDGQGLEVAQELRQLAVVVVADIEVGEDLRHGAEL